MQTADCEMPQSTQAYEIQIYQNGRWEFDSYFSDRDLVLSEAERMGLSPRFTGVRVLEELYNDETNKTECKVIFSRLAKNVGPNSDWRERMHRQSPGSGAAGAVEPGRRYVGPRSGAQPRKQTNLMVLTAIAAAIILVGIAAIILIREIAGAL